VLQASEDGPEPAMDNKDVIQEMLKQLRPSSLARAMALNSTFHELGILEENARRLEDTASILADVTQAFNRLRTIRAYNMQHSEQMTFQHDITVPPHEPGRTPHIQGRIYVTRADKAELLVCDLRALFEGTDSVTLTFTFYFTIIPTLVDVFSGIKHTRRTKIASFTTSKAPGPAAVRTRVSGGGVRYRSISYSTVPGTFTLTADGKDYGTYTFSGLYAATFRTSEALTAFAFCMHPEDFRRIKESWAPRRSGYDSDGDDLDMKFYRQQLR
jgi:hypothetical protein